MSTYHSGFVTVLSMTVPGGGFPRPGPDLAINLELILFFTTITATLGLKVHNIIKVTNETFF